MEYNYGKGGDAYTVTEREMSIQDAINLGIPSEEVNKVAKNGKVLVGTMKWEG